MIRKAKAKDYKLIEQYVAKDYVRNYFIALGLLKDSFKDIYIDETDRINSMLFYRKSGNLQFICYEKYESTDMCQIINSLEFKYLISAQSYCEVIESVLKPVKEGAFIAALNQETYLTEDTCARPLLYEELGEVEKLYSSVFTGYPKQSQMEEKFKSNRGIGYCIKDKQMIAVAQSDFSSLIVGVATDKTYQNKGYAKSCMHALIQEMFKTEKCVYLQYDDPIAGFLYDSLGFKVIDQVIHYEKR